jgi:hypothetical protein
VVFLANEEPLPLLLCADGLYGPLELGLDPLGLLPFGEGGVWGLICWLYDSLLPGTGGTPETLGPLAIPPARGPLSGPEVFLCSADRVFPPIAGDELLEDGPEGNVGEVLGEPSARSLKLGIGGGA